MTPPLFLIVSVSATSLADVFSPDHWRRLFVDRKDDLFTVYAVYSGALFMVGMLSMPLVMIAFAASYKLAILVGGVSFCLLFGVSVNLLGRLCGFFACGNLGMMERQPVSDPDLAPDVAPTPGPIASAAPIVNPTSSAEYPPESPVQPVANAAETQAVNVKSTRPDPATSSHPATATSTPFAIGASAQPAPRGEPVRRPLNDAKAQVETALKHFARDPDAALTALEKLHADFAPHPLVLQSLALHNYRAGRVGPAVAVAREAIPLCFKRGHSHMAAELFREMRQHRSHLALTPERLLTIAHTLAKMEDYAIAAKAYTAVIGQDHGESRAVKGLLQVAEKILHEKNKPEAAAKVYQYLLRHCSDSPLVEYMQTGLEEAEREIAHVTTG